MSEQTLKRILGALGILVILWIGSMLLSGKTGWRTRHPIVASHRCSTRLDQTTVSAVRIARIQDQTVALQQSGGAWTVNGNVTDSSAVTRLWERPRGSRGRRNRGKQPQKPCAHGLVRGQRAGRWTSHSPTAARRLCFVGKTGADYSQRLCAAARTRTRLRSCLETFDPHARPRASPTGGTRRFFESRYRRGGSSSVGDGRAGSSGG